MIKFLTTLLLLLKYSPITAEDAYSGNADSSNIEVCSNSAIEVTGISLLCDSPGTYYYGSKKYRNNIYCKLGDKAKVTVTFDIVGQLYDDPLVTMKAIAKDNGETATLYNSVKLCYLENLATTDGSTCPSTGSFTITTSFYWRSSSNNDENSSFYPILSVGFHSDEDPDYYDLGGANTGMCAGNTFIVINKFRYLSPLASFLLSMFILIGTVSIIAGVAWYLWRRSAFGPVPQDTFESYYSQESELEISDKQANMLRGNRQTLLNYGA